MKYLLDTNIIIDHLRGKEKIKEEIVAKGATVSLLSYGELLYGAHKSVNPPKTLTIIANFLKDFQISILPLGKESVEEYAKLKAQLETKGFALDDFDLLIAASALASSLVLVTKNKKHFTRVPGLKIL